MARRKSLLGLAQGSPGDFNPLWGVLVSGGAGTGAAIAVRSTTGMDKNAELIGMGVGVAAGAGLMLSRRTRAAGMVGIFTALVANGLRYAEAMLSAKQQIKDIAGAGVTHTAKGGVSVASQLEAAKAAAKAAGFGIVSPERVPTLRGLSAATIERRAALGAASVQQVPTLGGQGLGIVSPEVIRSLGAANMGQLPTFVGAGMGQGQRANVQIVGGGMGSHYGATIFG